MQNVRDKVTYSANNTPNKIQEMTYWNPNGTIHYPRGLHEFSIINS